MNPPLFDIIPIAKPDRRNTISTAATPCLAIQWDNFVAYAQTCFSDDAWAHFVKPLLSRLENSNWSSSPERLGAFLYREARRQEKNYPDRAQGLYCLLKGAHTSTDVLIFPFEIRAKAQKRIAIFNGDGTWVDRLENAAPVFLSGVSNPLSYASMFLGQGAYGLTRLGILSRLNRLPAQHLLRNAWFAKPLTTVGAAFTEAALTALGTQTLHAWLSPHAQADLMPFGASMGDALITSLALRSSHASTRPILQSTWTKKSLPRVVQSNLGHGVAILGIYGAHYLSAHYGWRASSITPWTDSLNTYIHMHTMGKLSQSFLGKGLETQLHQLESQFFYDATPFFKLIPPLNLRFPLGLRPALTTPNAGTHPWGQRMLMAGIKNPWKTDEAPTEAKLPSRSMVPEQPRDEDGAPAPRNHTPSSALSPDARFVQMMGQTDNRPIFSARNGTEIIPGILDIHASQILKARLMESCDLLLRLHEVNYDTTLWWGPTQTAISEAHAILRALDETIATTPHQSSWKETQAAYGKLWSLLRKIRSQVPYYNETTLEENPELFDTREAQHSQIRSIIESIYQSQNRLVNFLDNGQAQDLTDLHHHALEAHQKIIETFPQAAWDTVPNLAPHYDDIKGLSPSRSAGNFLDYERINHGRAFDLPKNYRRSVAFLGDKDQFRPSLLRHQSFLLSEDPLNLITDIPQLRHLSYSGPTGWVDTALPKKVSFLEAHFLLNQGQLQSLGADGFTEGLLTKLKPGGVALVTVRNDELTSFNVWLDHLEQRSDLQILRGEREQETYPTSANNNANNTSIDQIHYVMIRKLPESF